MPADAGGGLPQNSWEEVARVDYNMSDKTTMFGRYAAYHELDFDGTVNNSPYAGYNTGQKNFDQNVTWNITHVFSPNVVNTFKFIYNRLNGPVQGLGVNPAAPTLYTTGSVPALPRMASSWSSRDTPRQPPATVSPSAGRRTCISS